jgi:selenium donor protein
MVQQLPTGFDPSLLVGLAPFDDAAVYQLTDDIALVSTTDFFPPLVDDPSDFGAIAAANACSDVFAMGGRVVLAVNIAAFPEELPTDVIAAIFAAASATVLEAGGTIAGTLVGALHIVVRRIRKVLEITILHLRKLLSCSIRIIEAVVCNCLVGPS